MIEARLNNGRPMWIIKTPHYVTKHTFAMALSEHWLSIGGYTKPTRTEAKNILNDHLFFNGVGSDHKGLDSLGDAQEDLNELHTKAIGWIENSYPHFK